MHHPHATLSLLAPSPPSPSPPPPLTEDAPAAVILHFLPLLLDRLGAQVVSEVSEQLAPVVEHFTLGVCQRVVRHVSDTLVLQQGQTRAFSAVTSEDKYNNVTEVQSVCHRLAVTFSFLRTKNSNFSIVAITLQSVVLLNIAVKLLQIYFVVIIQRHF